MNLDLMIEKLENFQRNTDRIVIQEARKYEDQIISMNLQQLDAGQRSDKSPIEPPYTPFTVGIKRSKGQPTNRVTLKDTGDFYGAFEVAFNEADGEFSLFSTDWKNRKLETKYKREIYGLNQQNIDNLSQLLRPDIIGRFKKAIS